MTKGTENDRARLADHSTFFVQRRPLRDCQLMTSVRRRWLLQWNPRGAPPFRPQSTRSQTRPAVQHASEKRLHKSGNPIVVRPSPPYISSSQQGLRNRESCEFLPNRVALEYASVLSISLQLVSSKWNSHLKNELRSTISGSFFTCSEAEPGL